MSNQYDDDEIYYITKSQQKRDAEAQQDIGEKLIALVPSQLAKIPMDDILRDAILLAQRIRGKREGYRRQVQLVGKLMRQRDSAPIEQALHEVEHQHDAMNALFHQLEKHRDAIIAEGDSAIQAFIDRYPLADRQQLRQLQRNASKQQQLGKSPAAARELFKYLRQVASA